jgi:hypothetical protein
VISFGPHMIFPDAWASGPPDPPEVEICPACGWRQATGDGYCLDCASPLDDIDYMEWTGATGTCKFGGPAPCIDDICHALGGCMHYEGGR